MLVYGAKTRVKMRSKKYMGSYFSNRNTHITLGITLWLATKAKVWIVAKIEDDQQKLKVDMNKIAVIYFGTIFMLRIILEIFMKCKHHSIDR